MGQKSILLEMISSHFQVSQKRIWKLEWKEPCLKERLDQERGCHRQTAIWRLLSWEDVSMPHWPSFWKHWLRVIIL